MKYRTIYFIVFILSVLVRGILNFNIPLVPGSGGGYTIVQIREVIETGSLALPDMPLLFYLNAFIVKILISLFPAADPDHMIILVSKIIDTAVFPIILYPLYSIQRDLVNSEFLKSYLVGIAGFFVLSYAPLELASDAQKNSIALVFMTFYIYYFLKYLKLRNLKDLIVGSLFLLIICFTHFGVFVVSLVILFSGLIIFFKGKAIAAILVSGSFAVLLVMVLDPHRGMSMLTFWKHAFTIFFSPRLCYYPFGIFNYLFSFLLIWLIIRSLTKKKEEITGFRKNLLLLFLPVIIILSFPFYNFEFGRRLGLMSFVPQSITLLLLYPGFSRRVSLTISYGLIAVVIFTSFIKLTRPKPHAITTESYSDMQKLGKLIHHPDSTMIFARHGLEWWVAWEHHVHIAQPHIQVDQGMKERYDEIYFLVQENGENLMYPGKSSVFVEPDPPDDSDLIYQSEYFRVYQLKN